MAIANTTTVRNSFMSVVLCCVLTAGKYNVTGTWLPYLYRSIKSSYFLISTYIRQPAVKVSLLIRPSNIWPSCSRCCSFEWACHNVNLVITDTEMHFEYAKMCINLVMFLLSTIYFQSLNHQSRHYLLHWQWMYFFCHLHVP